MSGYAICPVCKKEVILRYPMSTKLNPFGPLKLIVKAVKGTFDEVKVICPKCGYKGDYGEFEKIIK